MRLSVNCESQRSYLGLYGVSQRRCFLGKLMATEGYGGGLHRCRDLGGFPLLLGPFEYKGFCVLESLAFGSSLALG